MNSRPIIFVINRLAVGGAERVVLDDIHEFTKQGVEVILITLRKEKRASLMSQCDLAEENRICIPFASFWNLTAWVAFIRTIRRLRPRALVSHLWFANTIARIGGRIAGVSKIITFEHNTYDHIKNIRQFALDRLLQGLSFRIVAVSEAVKDSLVRHGIRPEKVEVLTNGVRLERFQERDNSTSIRNTLGIDNEFVYLSIGRLVRQKGHDVLLSALASVDGHLLLVGEGEERQHLLEQMRTLGIEKRVHMLGVRSDVPRILASADCFVFPSRWEGAGIAMMEAMAAGLPIIATDFLAAREILKDKQDSLIIPIGDVDALVDKMRMVAAQPLLREKLSRSAKINAEIFSSKTHALKLLEII